MLCRLISCQAPPSSNFSEIFLSIWNTTNETFESTAQLFTQTRRRCQGKWNVSASDVTLIAANLLSPTTDQTVIQELNLDIGKWFTELLPEFNYRWYPPKNTQGFNTFPPLVASMVWSRVVSHNGHQNVDRADQDPGHAARTLYPKTPQDGQKTYTVVTLKRSGWLLFLLAINPILVIVAVFFKGFLYPVPVSDDFGLVSLLSGVKTDCLKLLHGAGLSGRLRDDVHVRFEILKADEIENTTANARTQVLLEKFGVSDSGNMSGKIERRIVYG